MNNYETMDDKELYDRIERGQLADNFLNSDNGRLIKEAGNRIVERAIAKLALSPDIMPNSLKGKDIVQFITEIVELRLTIRKYKYGLFEEIKMLAEDGLNAEDEMREIIENLDSETGIGQSP